MCPVSSEKKAAFHNESSLFHFRCHADLPCFTQCCRDVNIYLTPYDVLRMRKRLGISSAEFLAKYTRHFLAKQTHLPVVQLAMDPASLYCKLVTDEGCSVYSDRPWACRMYPLDLANQEGKYQPIVNQERCLGLRESTVLTVQEWLVGQGIEPYLEMDEVFRSIIPADLVTSGKLEPGVGKLLYLAYDLDRFAELLRDPHFRSFYELAEETIRQAESDPEMLLRLALRYIRGQMEELL